MITVVHWKYKVELLSIWMGKIDNIYDYSQLLNKIFQKPFCIFINYEIKLYFIQLSLRRVAGGKLEDIGLLTHYYEL